MNNDKILKRINRAIKAFGEAAKDAAFAGSYNSHDALEAERKYRKKREKLEKLIAEALNPVEKEAPAFSAKGCEGWASSYLKDYWVDVVRAAEEGADEGVDLHLLRFVKCKLEEEMLSRGIKFDQETI